MLPRNLIFLYKPAFASFSFFDEPVDSFDSRSSVTNGKIAPEKNEARRKLRNSVDHVTIETRQPRVEAWAMFTTPDLTTSAEIFFPSEPRGHSLSWNPLCVSCNSSSEFLCPGSVIGQGCSLLGRLYLISLLPELPQTSPVHTCERSLVSWLAKQLSRLRMRVRLLRGWNVGSNMGFSLIPHCRRM